MKRIVFLIMALALLALATSALSLVRPQTRRCNGDPDEFQARQVLDEGIAVAGSSLDAGGKRGDGQPPSNASRAKSTRQSEVKGRNQRPLISITFSGRTIFLER
jgi:hypothetical protein